MLAVLVLSEKLSQKNQNKGIERKRAFLKKPFRGMFEEYVCTHALVQALGGCWLASLPYSLKPGSLNPKLSVSGLTWKSQAQMVLCRAEDSCRFSCLPHRWPHRLHPLPSPEAALQ